MLLLLRQKQVNSLQYPHSNREQRKHVYNYPSVTKILAIQVRSLLVGLGVVMATRALKMENSLFRPDRQ